MSESTIQTLILVHVLFGATALLAGSIALSVKKGGFVHRKSGLIFVTTMLISSVVSMMVAVQPSHKSTFLFSIGILTIYFVIGGYLAVRYKKKYVNLLIDKCLALTMLVIGIAMMSHPFYMDQLNIVMIVFGALGTVFAVRDFIHFINHEELQKHWLPLHLGKITGGYISAFTAFIVVNKYIPGIAGWILPGVIGGIFIAVSIRRVKK
ncbi:MAG: DUF2306 domain-containing protein [Crocinitomicaceae bacterium]|nr:DUF2306 domain-containing protein [Crocinitomicaceae bacterium]